MIDYNGTWMTPAQANRLEGEAQTYMREQAIKRDRERAQEALKDALNNAPIVAPTASMPRVAEIRHKLVTRLSREPEGLWTITARQFEELICEMLVADGYEATLTKNTRDGGYDIAAYKPSEWAPALFLVECKRYRPDRAVGVSYVRALHGVVDLNRANGGIMVSTSRFSKDAQTFANDMREKLALRDYNFVLDWLTKLRS